MNPERPILDYRRVEPPKQRISRTGEWIVLAAFVVLSIFLFRLIS